MADLIKTFAYTAQDSQEVIQTGEYSAIDQNSVVTYLAGMDLTPINIAEKKKSVLEMNLRFFESVSPNEIYNFTRQLAGRMSRSLMPWKQWNQIRITRHSTV